MQLVHLVEVLRMFREDAKGNRNAEVLHRTHIFLYFIFIVIEHFFRFLKARNGVCNAKIILFAYSHSIASHGIVGIFPVRIFPVT